MATRTGTREHRRSQDGRPKTLTLPPHIEEALISAAERNYRSVSAEIRARLDHSLMIDGYLEGPEE